MIKTTKYLDSQIKNVQFGNSVTVVKPVNLYNCEISDNCFIGPFVEIQKNVKIGFGTKVQSHSFICELVTIGSNCFIGHGVMFINDKFVMGKPAGGNIDLWNSTFVSDNVYIGSNSTILPVQICSNVVIGAGSVVTKDINQPGIYAGNPAKLIKNN
jgi:acetyltransferase-like isoleucine patch superfamily enzyme